MTSAPVSPLRQRVYGTLASVNTNTLTITTRTGPVTLTVDSRTEIRLNGRRATLADLRAQLAAGRTVRIEAEYVLRAGTRLATRVHGFVRSGS